MNLAVIDWLIIAAFMAVLIGVASTIRRYSRGVSDFLAGNRCAGRYLLTLSEGMSAMGLAGLIASFEKFYQAGFAAAWWGTMLAPLGLIIALSGWVSYRYRQTRAMTMAQFFEMRYSRRFRVFAGIVGWASGVLNFGIFPGITARFLIYFCGFPEHFTVAGVSVSSLAVMMALMLTITVVLTLSGGMVTVMISDFLQAQFVNIVFLIVMGVLFWKVNWSDVAASLTTAAKGQSLVNPFDQAKIADFDVWFFAIFAFKLIYNRLGWQGTQGYNCAAKSPHEAKMAGVLAEWRGGVTYLMIMLMPICAYVVMHQPKFVADASIVQHTLNTIENPQIQKQMIVPIALVRLLPTGIAGLFCAALIAGSIGNDTTYLHAWGSIFIQDVILPFRKTAFTPQRHVNLLRLSIVGVAVFSFFFSLLFPLHDYVIMYLLVTGAIYLAGSGAVIVGGLYWSRGTTQGAWSAMLTGVILSLVGLAMRGIWPAVPALAAMSPQFPINGAWMALIASLTSIAVYVTVSLATCRALFDMDRLLNRTPSAVTAKSEVPVFSRRWLDRLIGITDECTRGDRLIYYLKIGWTGFWVLTFVIGTAWGLLANIPDSLWLKWWLFTVVVGAVVGAITIVWFLWGGFHDLFDLLRQLNHTSRDISDNGTVIAAVTEPVDPEIEIQTNELAEVHQVLNPLVP